MNTLIEKRTTEIKKVLNVIELYTKGSFNGDETSLSKAFHQEAKVIGYLQGELVMVPASVFIDRACNNTPSPKTTGEDYHSEVADVIVNSNTANVTLFEDSFQGHDFINHFQLIKQDGEWSIISKLFHHD